jgi:hypothetical protein
MAKSPEIINVKNKVKDKKKNPTALMLSTFGLISLFESVYFKISRYVSRSFFLMLVSSSKAV